MRNGIAGALKSEFRNLRAALRSFDRTLQKVIAANGSSQAPDAGPRRSRAHLSPKARATMVLQGRYMGYMRQLKPKQKAQVRKIREVKGVRMAIVRAREIAHP